METVRKAFDAFFVHYPYCYGYWKKYADLEKEPDKVEQVSNLLIWCSSSSISLMFEAGRDLKAQCVSFY